LLFCTAVLNGSGNFDMLQAGAFVNICFISMGKLLAAPLNKIPLYSPLFPLDGDNRLFCTAVLNGSNFDTLLAGAFVNIYIISVVKLLAAPLSYIFKSFYAPLEGGNESAVACLSSGL
jgi:hypothetical protein